MGAALGVTPLSSPADERSRRSRGRDDFARGYHVGQSAAVRTLASRVAAVKFWRRAHATNIRTKRTLPPRCTPAAITAST